MGFGGAALALQRAAMKVAQSGDYYSSLIAGNKREYTPKWFFRKVAKFFHQVDLASVDLISRPRAAAAGHRDVVCSSGHLLWSQESRSKVTYKIDGGRRPPLKQASNSKPAMYLTVRATKGRGRRWGGL